MEQSDDLLERTAHRYQELLAPAVFEPFASHVARFAALDGGDSALDVACGTGALTRALAERTDPRNVIGVDANPGMLSVARTLLPEAGWQQGDVSALPFDSGRFDAVTCQFALMIFEDRVGALAEMWRVLARGGRLVVALFDGLGHNAGYARMVEVYDRRAGPDIAAALRMPFSLGDVGTVRELLAEAGCAAPEVREIAVDARFSDARQLALSDIEGWFPFAGLSVPEETRAQIVADLAAAFAQGEADRQITFPVRARAYVARKP